MNRALQPELLDELPAADPRAVHSRRDLRRINALMGNHFWIRRYIRETFLHPVASPLLKESLGFLTDSSRVKSFRRRGFTIAEIGAGEGGAAFSAALCFSKILMHGGRVLLIDRQRVVSNKTLKDFEEIGWSVEIIESDVFAWLDSAPPVNVLIANLFLHHFDEQALQNLFTGVARTARCFAACEPRRSSFALWSARSLGCIGANEVTRHDGEISVRAGFRDDELSRVWPDHPGFAVTERRAGLFSHFFGAARRE